MAVLSCYYGGLDPREKVFGVGLAMREGLLLAWTLACVVVNPASLLVAKLLARQLTRHTRSQK